MPRITLKNPREVQALHSQRQQRAIARGDTIANSVDRAVGRLWREILDSLDSPAHQAAERVKSIMKRLFGVIREEVGTRLIALAKTTHDSIRKTTLDRIHFEQSVTEDVSDDPLLWWDLLKRFFPDSVPTPPVFTPSTLPTAGSLFQQYVLPAISGPEVLAIILKPHDGVSWVERIEAITSLAPPQTVASMVLHGISSGQSRVEIARSLRPILQNVKSSAMRVARTEGARVANDSAWQSHEQLAPMIVGYELDGVKDKGSRPWHRARHGVIYYRHPVGDQKGFDSLPHPPFEPANMDGVPAGEPRLAQHCRCFISPIFRDLDDNGEVTEATIRIRRSGNAFFSVIG